jgi:hypothetical protein
MRAARPRARPDTLLPGGGSHRLDDDIDATLVGQPTHGDVPLRVLCVVDHHVRPEFLDARQLVVGRCGGDDPSPHELGDLHGRQTHSAAGAQNQDSVRGSRPRMGDHHAPRRTPRDRQAGGEIERVCIRNSQGLPGRARHVLGETAWIHLAEHVPAQATRPLALTAVFTAPTPPVRIDEHPVAKRGPSHVGPHCRHHARHVSPGDVREGGGLPRHSLTGEDIEKVESAGLHPDEDLVRSGFRARPARLEGEYLGPAVTMHHHRPHGAW